jgi:hypothetical protein
MSLNAFSTRNLVAPPQSPGHSRDLLLAEGAPQTRRGVNPSRPRRRFVLSVEDEDEDDDEDEKLIRLQRILIFKDSSESRESKAPRKQRLLE